MMILYGKCDGMETGDGSVSPRDAEPSSVFRRIIHLYRNMALPNAKSLTSRQADLL